MTVRLQEWIHKFEEGPGSALVSAVLGVTAMLAVAVFYDLTALQNLSSPEGMDQAQLARNVAGGKGFTTSFIRPLSLHLIFRTATNHLARLAPLTADATDDSPKASQAEQRWLARLQQQHPDLANPPLYPLLLAAALKLSPFGSSANATQESTGLVLNDFWITLLNQLLFLLAAGLIFRLAKKLFDRSVAWLSALVMLGSELLWRLTTTGQATCLQMVILLALVGTLAKIESAARPEATRSRGLVWLSAWAGLLVGLGGLTCYALGGLILPVVVMLGSAPLPKRAGLVGACLLAFLLVVAPWTARNYYLGGTLFGTAGYALFQDTTSFPEDTLERSINPDFREFAANELTSKLVRNLGELVQSDLPRLGGSWVSAFFLVGLLVPFRNRVLGRIRGFLLLSLGLMVLVRSLFKAGGPPVEGIEPPDAILSSFAPLVFVFGVGLFYTLLEQLAVRVPGIRFPTLGLFCLVMIAPLLLAFFRPATTRLALPYYPPWVREKSGFLGEEDWMMSDIPWAVAWYGGQGCVWLPPFYKNPAEGKYHNDFFEIHNRFKAIRALYLSAKTLEKVDTRPLRSWIGRADEGPGWENSIWEWESFVLVAIYLKSEVPTGFPLKNAPLGI
jgi:4-amino-4-deoxy-L-arabinose transferase-like glycosyltransferase